MEQIKLFKHGNKSSLKTIFQDALRRTQNDHRVLLEIGVSFYAEAQYETSLKWLERALKSARVTEIHGFGYLGHMQG